MLLRAVLAMNRTFLDELKPHVDRAIEVGHAVTFRDWWVVPDVAVLEAVANGHRIKLGRGVERCDKRCCYLFHRRAAS